MRAVMYCKVSIDNRSKKSRDEKVKMYRADLEAQYDRCVSYIKAKEWELTGMYVDYKSGKERNRPEAQRMFQDVMCGKIDAVVLTCPSLIIHDYKDFRDLIEFIDKYKFTFIHLDGDYDLSTQAGRSKTNLEMLLALSE